MPEPGGVGMKGINLVCHTHVIKCKWTFWGRATGLNFKLKLVLGCVWFLRPARAFRFDHTVFVQMEGAMNVQVYTQPG